METDAEKIARLEAALRQVDDVLVVNWITVKNGDYRQALYDLGWSMIQIHNDPSVSKEAKSMADELTRLRAVGSAAAKLLEKMDRIQSSDAYKAVWMLAYAHGAEYKGETWELEYASLRTALTGPLPAGKDRPDDPAPWDMVGR